MLQRMTAPGTKRLSTMASETPSTSDGTRSVIPAINSPTAIAAPALSSPASAANGTVEPGRGLSRARRLPRRSTAAC